MKLTYKGSSTALNFLLDGEMVRVTPNQSATLTPSQADELKNHPFASELIQQKTLLLSDGETADKNSDAEQGDTPAPEKATQPKLTAKTSQKTEVK